MKARKLLKALALTAAFAGVVGLASCGETTTTTVAQQEVNLDGLLLKQDGMTISEDFTLPQTVGKENHAITWTSSNTNVLEVTDYKAIIKRPEVTTDVTLTAKVGSATKTFTVTVTAVTAQEIADAYICEIAGTIVTTGEYDLPSKFDYELKNTLSETPYDAKQASVAWSITENEYAKIEGSKLVVNADETVVKLQLSATFTYNGETALKNYTIIVQFKEDLTPAQKMEYWYANVGNKEAQTFNGYVVWLGSYSEQYKNCQIYMIDESYTGGIYCYNTPISAADYAQLKIGSGITVTGITSCIYNGLIESEAKSGQITLNNTLPAYDEAKATKAIDELVFVNEYAGKDQLLHLQNTMVSLSGWKVTEVGPKDKLQDGATNNALIVKVAKGDVELKVIISKYPTPLTGEAYKDFANLDTFAVGDIVDIKGILSNYSNGQSTMNAFTNEINNYQILAVDSKSVVKSANQVESTVDVSDIDAAMAALDVLNIAELSVVPTEYALNVTAPAGATITFAAKGACVKIVDGKLVVTPTAALKVNTLTATIEVGGYTFAKTWEITTQSVSDAEMVEEAIKEVTLEADYDAEQTIDLLLNGTVFTDVAFTYSLPDTVKGAAIVDGKLVVTPGTADETVVLTVTATKGEATQSKEITFVVKAGIIAAKAIVSGAPYKFALYQGNLGTLQYLTGAMDGYYYATTTDASAAANVYFEAVEGGYNMYVVVDGAKSYLNIINTGTHINVVFEAAASSVWTWNAELNTVTTDLEGTVYYLGTRTDKNYTTFSACKLTQTNFIAQFYPITEAVTSIEADQAYLFKLHQGNLDTDQYLTGAMDGYYYATTTDASAAANVYFEAVEGGYNMYVVVDGAKSYLNIINTGTHINVVFEAAASSVWTWNAELNTVTTDLEGTVFYLGTRTDKNYTTFSACKLDQTNFVAQFFYDYVA